MEVIHSNGDNRGQLANVVLRRTTFFRGHCRCYIVYRTKKNGVKGWAYRQINADFATFPRGSFHNHHEPMESIPAADAAALREARRSIDAALPPVRLASPAEMHAVV
jgi:hypothetical protein